MIFISVVWGIYSVGDGAYRPLLAAVGGCVFILAALAAETFMGM